MTLIKPQSQSQSPSQPPPPHPLPTPLQASSTSPDAPASAYTSHSSAQRTNTDVVLAESLRTAYPSLTLTVTPSQTCDLLSYAASGHATATPLTDTTSPLGASLKWRRWIPPARRSSGSNGVLADMVVFGKYLYKWTPTPGEKEVELMLYIANGRDGSMAYPQVVNNYILSSPSQRSSVDSLIAGCGAWMLALRSEVLVFDGGFWQKSRELWESVQGSRWEDVILDEGMKGDIIGDVEGFFEARETYERLKVPWKRGVIYYGPPGNGKTISIKAMMRALDGRGKKEGREAIPSLYVKSLASFAGPEYSVKQIFGKARQEAPCYLIFEDLDSVVTDAVRSYFLNEVDGLKSNDGIFMVGSTNHLDRLDPGIAKRPSRFDRKYKFPNPNPKERETYCHYWQGKLKDNEDVEFPDELCPAIAAITDGFSFAYIQEAFVASLLAIARKSKRTGGLLVGENGQNLAINKVINLLSSPEELEKEDPGLDKYELWIEMKKQVKALREGLDESADRKQKAIIRW